MEHRKQVAIKILRAISTSKIKRELFITNRLNHPNIVKILGVVRCSEAKTASMVLELVPHQDFRLIYPGFNTADIKHYMRELFSVDTMVTADPRLHPLPGNHAQGYQTS